MEERSKIEAEVHAMIGMRSAKAFFEETKQIVLYLESGGNPEILRTSLNMVITGNPGAASRTAIGTFGVRVSTRSTPTRYTRSTGEHPIEQLLGSR